MSYRYLGNKKRIASWIVEIIREFVKPRGTIVDPMCGTGAISEALAELNFNVIASDILRFPTLHAKARLLSINDSNFTGMGGSYKSAILILNNLASKKGFFWQEYSGDGIPANGSKPRKYFTGENASKIDAIRDQLKIWSDAGLDSLAVDRLTHDLILSTNKVANISGTYGYYCANYTKSSLGGLALVTSPIVDFSQKNKVYHKSLDDLALTIEADAFYLDPPYTKRQYGGNYHIPETIGNHDKPEPAGEGGLRDWKIDSSDFCYKRKVREAFSKSISLIKAKYIFISYSDDGQLPSAELELLLEKFGALQKFETKLARFKSNSAGLDKKFVTETLYVLEKK